MAQITKWIVELSIDGADDWEQLESKLQGLEDILQAAATALDIEITDFEQSKG